MSETKEDILKYITELRDNKLSLFRKDVKLLLEHYNNEVETSRSYHGRQLLELIQNADDQRASEILVVLDEENGTISVSNDGGIPFSKKGYDSLFYAHLSSKKGEEFIGHKGLGLRSILMWGEEFRIISNDIELAFSQKIAKKELSRMLSTDAVFKKMYTDEMRSRNNRDACPLPVFSCPQIESSPTIKCADGYTTTIYATYKKEGGILDNIKSQISELNSEILLFLPHIKTIKFQGVDKEDIICDKKSLEAKQISEGITLTTVKIDGTRWKIYEKTGKLRTIENKKYQVKLAISNGEFRDSCLYCFFPTNITLNTPYILHGTFELDPTRNGINESIGNEEVAKHLAHLIIGVAKYITSLLNRKADWLPLKMLLIGLSKNISLSKVKFYQCIEEALYNEAIYPCLDKSYRKISKVTFVSNEFSQLIQAIESEEIFPSMLLPDTFDLLRHLNKSIDASVPNIEKYISKVNLDGFSISKRAELIYQLVTHFPGRQFNLLLDNESRKIAKDTILFSPIDRDIYIPAFCKIRIINRELYNELKRRFEITGTNPARELAQKLASFNFKAYEPAPLVAKIIEECNKQTRKRQTDSYIKETVQNLYKNYCYNIITEETKKTELLLPTQNGNFEKASNLFLSKEYPTGSIAYDIFSHLRTEKDYVVPFTYFGIRKEDIDRFEKFLNWLGVNSFVRYRIITSYSDTVKSYLGFFNNIIKVNVQTIDHIDEILDKLSIEQVLLWIHADEVIRKSLSTKHEDKLTYKYYNSPHDKDKEYSLIKSIFRKHGFDYSDFILEENFQWANSSTIDYASPILVKHSINRRSLESYLTLLDAKDNLESMSTKSIVKILTSMTGSSYFKNGRKSQITYERILNILKDRADAKSKVPTKYNVFASIGKEIVIRSNTDCYFSERIDIPNQLRALYPIFNYPRRAGGAKAIEIFKINDLLSKIEIKITQSVVSHHDNEFQSNFSEFKPVLLSVRLNNIRSEDSFRKNEKDILDKLDIKLCSDVRFKTKEEDEDILDDYSYILSGETYYIKVNDSTFALQKDKDRFNGCVASILSSAFKLTEDASFEIILSKRLEDAEEWVSNKYGEDILTEAYRRFNRLDSKLEFCKSIKTLLHINFTEENLFSELVVGEKKYDLLNWLSDYDNRKHPKKYIFQFV